MNQQTMDIAERYVHATRGQMYFDLTYSSRSDRAEKSAAAAQDIGQYRPPAAAGLCQEPRSTRDLRGGNGEPLGHAIVAP